MPISGETELESDWFLESSKKEKYAMDSESRSPCIVYLLNEIQNFFKKSICLEEEPKRNAADYRGVFQSKHPY